MPGQLPTGGASYAAAEQSVLKSRRLRENEEEHESYVLELERARDSLLEEVTLLSERNSELEESGAALEKLRGELNTQAETMDALLTLLGEKEEEEEAQMGDMREVKNLYSGEIRELSERLVASLGAAKEDTA